jgi:serine protease Do
MRVGSMLVIVLAACASPPPDEPSASVRPAESASLVPGTIGAVVAPAQGGVRVAALAADGPASHAGVRVGDLVVRCGGKPIATVRQFNGEVLATRPGDRLRLDLQRDSQPVSVRVDVMALQTALRL